jgi:hypothetical protein
MRELVKRVVLLFLLATASMCMPSLGFADEWTATDAQGLAYSADNIYGASDSASRNALYTPKLTWDTWVSGLGASGVEDPDGWTARINAIQAADAASDNMYSEMENANSQAVLYFNIADNYKDAGDAAYDALDWETAEENYVAAEAFFNVATLWKQETETYAAPTLLWYETALDNRIPD